MPRGGGGRKECGLSMDGVCGREVAAGMVALDTLPPVHTHLSTLVHPRDKETFLSGPLTLSPCPHISILTPIRMQVQRKVRQEMQSYGRSVGADKVLQGCARSIRFVGVVGGWRLAHTLTLMPHAYSYIFTLHIAGVDASKLHVIPIAVNTTQV